MAISSQEWSKLHPIRWKRMRRKCWLKRRKVECKYCGIPLAVDGKIKQFCSAMCRETQRKERVKAWRDAVHFLFVLDKERTGCAHCGYHRYGGALDYHHVDSKTKDGRITAMLWYNQTPKYQSEVAKCVLLCKNCHYTAHERERFDGTI